MYRITDCFGEYVMDVESEQAARTWLAALLVGYRDPHIDEVRTPDGALHLLARANCLHDYTVREEPCATET